MYVNLNRDVDRLDGPGQPRKEDREKAMELTKPLTPRSERPRRTWGSLAVSVQMVRGLCEYGRCIRRMGHAGVCYPAEPASG